MATSSLRSLALVGIVAVSALALSGCSVIESIFPAQAERDADTQEVKTEGEADVFTMKVGDCLDNQEADEVETIPAVPCDQPHDLEAYYSFDLEDADEYPGQTAVTDLADEGCYNAFPDFIGISYEESSYDFTYFFPTTESWTNGGDREIMCLIGSADEKTTGSLAGVAR